MHILSLTRFYVPFSFTNSCESNLAYLFLLDATNWIDVCQSDGNLLALVGSAINIQIFDKRESKFVKMFDKIQIGKIL